MGSDPGKETGLVMVFIRGEGEGYGEGWRVRREGYGEGE